MGATALIAILLSITALVLVYNKTKGQGSAGGQGGQGSAGGKGEKGEKGEKGDPGKDGVCPDCSANSDMIDALNKSVKYTNLSEILKCFGYMQHSDRYDRCMKNAPHRDPDDTLLSPLLIGKDTNTKNLLKNVV